jgi:ribosome-associated heat shock protein Hsp15
MDGSPQSQKGNRKSQKDDPQRAANLTSAFPARAAVSEGARKLYPKAVHGRYHELVDIMKPEAAASPAAVRIDIWLDVVCLFKTRSEAQNACQLGKIAVNGQTAKPHRTIRPGDEIDIGRPFGRKQKIRVVGLADKHIARAEARALYEDLTPPPTAEEIEMRRVERIYRAAVTPVKAPDKRERRERRRMKEGAE